jgi:hypothetical protein
MSVRNIWRIQRINDLKLPVAVRNSLIESIVAKQGKVVTLVAWDVDYTSTAKKAFLSEKQTILDWVKTEGVKALHENTSIPRTVRLISWEMNLQEAIKFISEGEIKDIPVPKTNKKRYIPIPKEIFNGIRESLKQIKP